MVDEISTKLRLPFFEGKSCLIFQLSDKNRCFSFVCNYLLPSNNSRQLIFNINAVVLIVIIC